MQPLIVPIECVAPGAMKIINIHKSISPYEICGVINQKLDPLFAAQRKTTIHFSCRTVDDAVEIYQPELYDGFLFRIEIKGEELYITRSEHYVDDVNSLTVESILNEIFEELSDDGRVTLIQEG